MILLATNLWPGLAAALLLGLCIGALVGLPRGRFGLITAALPVAALAALVTLSVLALVPGEAGLKVETGALMLGAYLGGCTLGGIGRALAGRG